VCVVSAHVCVFVWFFAYVFVGVWFGAVAFACFRLNECALHI